MIADSRGSIALYSETKGGYCPRCLLKEAVKVAQRRWLGERFYTYVNPRKIKSTNPGYCFICAGWKVCGKIKGDLVILEYKGEIG